MEILTSHFKFLGSNSFQYLVVYIEIWFRLYAFDEVMILHRNNHIIAAEITWQLRNHKKENHEGMKGKENGLIWSNGMPPPRMYNGITSNFLFYETCLNIGRHIFPALKFRKWTRCWLSLRVILNRHSLCPDMIYYPVILVEISMVFQ